MAEIEEQSKTVAPCPTFSGDDGNQPGTQLDPSLGFERWHSKFCTYLQLKGITDPGPQAPEGDRNRFEAKRVGHLKNFLRGSASNLVYGLSHADQGSYNRILAALREAYSLNPHTAWQAFKSRVLRSGEVVDSLLAALRSLLSLAAPSLTGVDAERLLKLQFDAALPDESLMKNQVLARDLVTTPLTELLQTAKSFTKPPGSQSNVVAPPDPPLMAATFYGKGKKGFGKGASKGRSGKPFFPYGK
ncbi:hypothetical protein FOZ62_027936, partial [Perkinsus olseni]